MAVHHALHLLCHPQASSYAKMPQRESTLNKRGGTCAGQDRSIAVDIHSVGVSSGSAVACHTALV